MFGGGSFESESVESNKKITSTRQITVCCSRWTWCGVDCWELTSCMGGCTKRSATTQRNSHGWLLRTNELRGFNTWPANLYLRLINHVCNQLAKMAVVVANSCVGDFLAESHDLLYSAPSQPHVCQVEYDVNLDLEPSKKVFAKRLLFARQLLHFSCRKEVFLSLIPILPPQSTSMQNSSSIGLMTPCWTK